MSDLSSVKVGDEVMWFEDAHFYGPSIPKKSRVSRVMAKHFMVKGLGNEKYRFDGHRAGDHYRGNYILPFDQSQ